MESQQKEQDHLDRTEAAKNVEASQRQVERRGVDQASKVPAECVEDAKQRNEEELKPLAVLVDEGKTYLVGNPGKHDEGINVQKDQAREIALRSSACLFDLRDLGAELNSLGICFTVRRSKGSWRPAASGT